jgi:hypothetical protein
LAQKREVPNYKNLPPLTEGQILRWADLHFQRTRTWPKRKSGPVVDALGETWARVDAALLVGLRGLPGGSSLHRLLREHRGTLPAQTAIPVSLGAEKPDGQSQDQAENPL